LEVHILDDNNTNTKKSNKWEFEDYAFVLTGVIVFFLLPFPEILYSQFGISILGGGDISPDLLEELDDGYSANMLSIGMLRALSPMLFLLTTTICFWKDAIDARRTGGYTGSVFTHTFESLFEDAIYMAITTIMVYGAVLFGAMYASWLAGPITWILFIFIFPLVRKKSDSENKEKLPWILLLIFVAGIITEVFTGAWIAFPLSWLVISFLKLIDVFRAKVFTVDTIFDILYYAFSVVLMAVGIILDFWITSWMAFPIALFICWILSKTKKFKKVESE